MLEHILASLDSPFASVINKHTSLGGLRTPYCMLPPHTIAMWSEHIAKSMPTRYALQRKKTHDPRMRHMCLPNLLCRHIVSNGGYEIVELEFETWPAPMNHMLHPGIPIHHDQANGTMLHRHIAGGCIHVWRAQTDPTSHTTTSMRQAIAAVDGDAECSFLVLPQGIGIETG